MDCSNESLSELLNSETTSFVVSSSIHHNGMTPAEEEHLALLLEHAMLQVMNPNFFSTSRSEARDAVRDLTHFIELWDEDNEIPRFRFNNMNQVESEYSMHAWNPSAYDRIYRFER